jgi:hypothetical protein
MNTQKVLVRETGAAMAPYSIYWAETLFSTRTPMQAKSTGIEINDRPDKTLPATKISDNQNLGRFNESLESPIGRQ